MKSARLLFFLGSLLSAQAAAQPSVDIERVAPKRWRATFHFVSPTRSISFDRPASFFRERVFTIVTPGYRFTRDGGSQYATLDSGGTPRTEIAFEFPEFVDALPKEYELFQPFTDGAVAIYTGHFHARATGTSASDTTRVRTIRIHSMHGTHVVVRGRVERASVVAFEDATGDGTYVYIGTARPIETKDVVAIVDPGMPPWLKEMFDQRLPDLFHEYAMRFDAKLPWKPVVLFGYDSTGTGPSSGGGTLTGLLSMVLTGSAWRTPTPALREQAFSLIAHESAHLWNGQLAHNRAGNTSSWMHEGSADALSTEMLAFFGIVDSSRYRARRAEAFNRCVAAVRMTSVEAALTAGSGRTVYDCGFVMAIWTEAALRRVQPSATMFTFWRALVRAAAARPKSDYDDSTYYRVLTSSGVPASVASRMRAFLASRDSASIAIDGLIASGVPVRAGDGDPPAQYQLDAARAVMYHLMQQTCGRVSFNAGAPLRTQSVPACAPFAKAMEVFRIQDLRVKDQGAAIHDAVRAACDAKTDITLGAEDGTPLASFACTKPLAALTPWYVLGSR